MYAEDVLLMAISVTHLQAMVNLCIKEFDCLDMCINSNKSICIRIGPNHKVRASSMTVQDRNLVWKDELCYLGVYFISSNSIKSNLQPPRQKFYRAINGIFSKIGTNASPALTLSLVQTLCLSVLL